MAVSVRRDCFARGEYRREVVRVKECGWCGRTGRTFYNYAWENDDRTSPSRVDSHHGFCNFQCFALYHGH